MERCYRAVPLNHVRDLACKRSVLALRCSKTGCISCADFEVDGRSAFEERLRSEYDRIEIRRWNCDVSELRDLAISAGVTDIPAYIIITSSGHVTVKPVT